MGKNKTYKHKTIYFITNILSNWLIAWTQPCNITFLFSLYFWCKMNMKTRIKNNKKLKNDMIDTYQHHSLYHNTGYANHSRNTRNMALGVYVLMTVPIDPWKETKVAKIEWSCVATWLFEYETWNFHNSCRTLVPCFVCTCNDFFLQVLDEPNKVLHSFIFCTTKVSCCFWSQKTQY